MVRRLSRRNYRSKKVKSRGSRSLRKRVKSRRTRSLKSRRSLRRRRMRGGIRAQGWDVGVRVRVENQGDGMLQAYSCCDEDGNYKDINVTMDKGEALTNLRQDQITLI